MDFKSTPTIQGNPILKSGDALIQKTKAGAFIDGDLQAGQMGVDTVTGDIYTSLNGTTVVRYPREPGVALGSTVGFAVRSNGGAGGGSNISITPDSWQVVTEAVLASVEWNTHPANWNGTTGTWTCPVGGVYDFNGHLTTPSLGDTDKMMVSLYKNGVIYALFSRGVGGVDGSNNPQFCGFGGSITVPMAVNDTASIRVYSTRPGFSLNNQNGYCHFAAYRVDDKVEEEIVYHGVDGTMARPNASRVIWVGSAPPQNAQDQDEWRKLSV